jgi:hypothetical protein
MSTMPVMSRTFRKREVSWGSPRNLQEKRSKQALQAEIDQEAELRSENLKKIRSPLYKWELERKKNAV